MAFMKITRQGLASMFVLVLILWSCIFIERNLARRAQMDTYRALRDMRYLKLKRSVEPASAPAPVEVPKVRRSRSAIG